MDFMRKTSQCSLFLLPIIPGVKRIAGDQSILNAMFYGKIVIATDSIGSRNYIVNGINGFIVPESDSEAWINTINYALNLNTREYEKIVSNAIYTAKEVFSETNRIKKILIETKDLINDQK
jgi:glycosyltransferase involved in cell wall biosynthesis